MMVYQWIFQFRLMIQLWYGLLMSIYNISMVEIWADSQWGSTTGWWLKYGLIPNGGWQTIDELNLGWISMKVYDELRSGIFLSLFFNQSVLVNKNLIILECHNISLIHFSIFCQGALAYVGLPRVWLCWESNTVTGK